MKDSVLTEFSCGFCHKKCVRARGWCGVCECAGGCVWVGSMAVGVWLKRIPIV